jgi:AraC-like DNA-binding protein
MKLQFIQPRPDLANHITKIWLFENSYGLTGHGALIAPNAKPKIIIPFRNGITTTDGNKTTTCHEGDVCLIGIRDVPVTLGTPSGATGSIGIELTTAGAYKFLNLSMSELTNNLYSFSEIFGRLGKELISRTQDIPDPILKIDAIQEFLSTRLIENKRTNSVIDYAVDRLLTSNGMLEIKHLEKKTGYSHRYLNMLFKEHLGISPKTYSTILRFQAYYKQWSKDSSAYFNKEKIFELYYDQAHFIREFKRYTGQTPTQLAGFKNDFGRNF